MTLKNWYKIALNREAVELSELESRVRSLVEPNSETLAIANADEQVKHGKVVAVRDRLRGVEKVKLAIALGAGATAPIATQNP